MDRIEHDFVVQTCRLLSARSLEFLAQLDKTWFIPARETREKIALINVVMRQPFRTEVYGKMLLNSRKFVPDYGDRTVNYRVDDLSISHSNATKDCDVLHEEDVEDWLGLASVQCNSAHILNMGSLATFRIYNLNVRCLKYVEIINTTLNNEPDVVDWLKRLMKAGCIETLFLNVVKLVGPSNIQDDDFTEMLINEKQIRNFRLIGNVNFPNFNLSMLKTIIEVWSKNDRALGSEFKIWDANLRKSRQAREFVALTFAKIEEEEGKFRLQHPKCESWIETDLEMVYIHLR